jgi:hypothetical protein
LHPGRTPASYPTPAAEVLAYPHMTASREPAWRRIEPADGTLYCEGPPTGSSQGVTSCDGGPDLFRGRRARWLRGSRPLCGTCKKAMEAKA